MPYVEYKKTINYTTESNHDQLDLRYNYIDNSWISRWIDDSITFGDGFGHFEDQVVENELSERNVLAGNRIIIGDNKIECSILFIEGDGTERGSVLLDRKIETGRVHGIYGTQFTNNRLRIAYLSGDSPYNGAPMFSYLYGSGKDGAFHERIGEFIINIYTRIDGNVIGGEKVIPVEDTSGFQENDEILVIQTQYSESDVNYYGNFEFHYIDRIIDENHIQTKWPIGLPFISDDPNLSVECYPNSKYYPVVYAKDLNDEEIAEEKFGDLPHIGYKKLGACSYNGNSRTAQVIRVPHFTSVWIGNLAIIKAKSWDGHTGGFVVFRANDRVDIFGAIDVTGQGFRGSFRPPDLALKYWDSRGSAEDVYYIPHFHRWVYYYTQHNYHFGSTGEGCHGYGYYVPTKSASGKGGGGGTARMAYYSTGYYSIWHPAPGAGGSFGSLGGSSYYTAEWWRSLNSNGSFTIRAYPSNIICNNQLTKLTLGAGGGGTMWKYGGNGSGAICIFTRRLHVFETGKLLAHGVLGDLGSCGYQNDGGHGSGGPIVIYAYEMLTNDGIISGKGAEYESGEMCRGGKGGDGRIVYDTNEYIGNPPENFGTTHIHPNTLLECSKWGKIPFNLVNCLSVPYHVKNILTYKLDVRQMRLISGFEIEYIVPYFASQTSIRILLSFNNQRTWLSWDTENKYWKEVKLRFIGDDGMPPEVFKVLTNTEIMKNNAFNQNTEFIDIAISLTTGIRMDSPEIESVSVNGKTRTWQMWGIKYPRYVNNLPIRLVDSVLSYENT